MMFIVLFRSVISELCHSQNRDDDIVSFANDAIKFVFVFGPPISQSALHVYLSALPFAPKNSQVAKHYLSLFPKTLHLKTGKAKDWPAIIGVCHSLIAGIGRRIRIHVPARGRQF